MLPKGVSVQNFSNIFKTLPFIFRHSICYCKYEFLIMTISVSYRGGAINSFFLFSTFWHSQFKKLALKNQCYYTVWFLSSVGRYLKSLVISQPVLECIKNKTLCYVYENEGSFTRSHAKFSVDLNFSHFSVINDSGVTEH